MDARERRRDGRIGLAKIKAVATWSRAADLDLRRRIRQWPIATTKPPLPENAGGGDRRTGRPRPSWRTGVGRRNRIAAAEQQRDEYLDLLQRTRADFENYQKRTQRDLAEERRYASAPSPGNCCRSWTTCSGPWTPPRSRRSRGRWPGEWPWSVATDRIFGRFGIAPIDALDQPFDPHLHEAVRSSTPGRCAPRARWSRSCNPVIACMSGSCARPRWPWRRQPAPEA